MSWAGANECSRHNRAQAVQISLPLWISNARTRAGAALNKNEYRYQQKIQLEVLGSFYDDKQMIIRWSKRKITPLNTGILEFLKAAAWLNEWLK